MPSPEFTAIRQTSHNDAPIYTVRIWERMRPQFGPGQWKALGEFGEPLLHQLPWLAIRFQVQSIADCKRKRRSAEEGSVLFRRLVP
jgi:hypothetical protein